MNLAQQDQIDGAANAQNPILFVDDRNSAIRQNIDSFKMAGVIEDAVRLKLISYSLTDRARAWLKSLLPNWLNDS
ncbi:hypothetical protein EPI10_015726 [Gossypium australe]|uniref:Uncharacterized protein n=1 Tax=Gossypium australe TaxID=47621 RepID=A0A5B6VLK4_9ROSI|nr:hypothetical protein EPI10_015726 [Gossypium australe]